MEDASFQIEIPCDNGGHVLFQCPQCGELFKVKPSDVEDDAILHTYCPACGLTSDSFLTEDVLKLAWAKALNWTSEQIGKELKSLAKKINSKSSLVSIQVKTSSHEEDEPTLMPAVEALVHSTCAECDRTAMVSPLLAMSSHTCPFCGIGQFNER